MLYFTPEHHQACQQETDSSAQSEAQARLAHLYQHLAAQARIANFDLHAPSVGPQRGSACDRQAQALSVRFMRSVGAALTVERLMGRENVVSAQHVIPQHHPSIELRLQADYLVVELLAPADAWWDQQNIGGKLLIPRQRTAFFSLLQALDKDLCLGFWQGAHLSELHLKVHHLQKTDILYEWLSTFEPSKDHFRLGRWYAAASLEADRIEAEVLHTVRSLYSIYEAILWTSENNYREAYLNALEPQPQDEVD